ncbi:protein hold'em [Sitodiplosis mosellana]|uniref:protein hold'em n=1 Tax=Sitodiplosis mosellana TaxID=263140 RepID=UPI0024450885|nr:protein hold'em [Sitodiplosis mosellana]
MAAVYCQIKDLTLHAHSFYINALIIAKTEKRAVQPGRNVITFTVRDTKDHFINCTVWGQDQYIDVCARVHKIGDIISIYTPKVQQKNNGSEYHPRTTSPFELTVSEGKAYIHRVNEQSDDLLRLQCLAVKPTSLALKLNDLNFYSDSKVLSVDVVVLVKSIEPARQVQTKFGVKTMRKVYLMDMTTESISMTVWHAEYQERMDQWKPLETVLHLVDVRAEYSEFERSTVLSVTSKTIIVENPMYSSRSNEILVYLHELDAEKFNELKSNQPKAVVNAATIKDVMTVKGILNAIERDPSKEISAIVYGVITKFDITSGVVKSCVHCKRMLLRNRNECGTASCETSTTNGPRYIDKIFMAVSVADHSGTLNCRINDEYAVNILGHTAQQLKALPDDDVNAIFENFMLQRFAVKMIVRPKSQTEYFASILSIATEPPKDVAKALKL